MLIVATPIPGPIPAPTPGPTEGRRVVVPDPVGTGMALPPYDDALLRRPNRKIRMAVLLGRHAQVPAAILRAVAPILRVRGLVVVTRDEDVREVLRRDRDFPVPFGPNFEATDETGTNFVLGMADTPEYRAIRAETMRVFGLDDVARVGAIARARAEAIVAASPGSMDVVRDLLVRVLLDITRDYYGVDLPFPDGAHWMMAISFFDFSPVADPAIRAAALAASRRVALAVDAALARAHAGELPDTVVGRFVAAQAAQAARGGPVVVTDAVIRATVTGMIAGFVPTDAIATGHIMDMLLDRPDMLAACQAAARSGDDGLLDRCLLEVLRFHPINPGPFRLVNGTPVLAAGTRRATRLQPGDKVWAWTTSAMFDGRRVRAPRRFDPAREPSDYLHFGFGQHWCIGFALARAQMVQTFKPLLLRTGIRRADGPAGKMAVYGSFPDRMTILHGVAEAVAA